MLVARVERMYSLFTPEAKRQFLLFLEEHARVKKYTVLTTEPVDGWCLELEGRIFRSGYWTTVIDDFLNTKQ